MAKRKKPIIGVQYSYVGTDADFEKFLHALVRDYLGADSHGPWIVCTACRGILLCKA